MKIEISKEQLKLLNRLITYEISQTQAELLRNPMKRTSEYCVGLTELHEKILGAIRK